MYGSVLCRQCQEPMHGIMDAAARHTCYECGGISLVAEQREKEKRELRLQKTFKRATITVSSPTGGNAA